ncbi:MAG: protein phosphatase 2C domain-containing protein [Lachnospiraceae bacterium]|nr:protein phosphatase 2C domain-containing protein [Lachnospiraceae bacterium]
MVNGRFRKLVKTTYVVYYNIVTEKGLGLYALAAGWEYNKMNQDEIITQEDHRIPTVKIGMSSVLGTRKTQQDVVYSFSREPLHLAVVCDGMGGLEGGEIASRIAAETLAADFLELDEEEDIYSFLRDEALRLDEQVWNLRGENGEFLDAGTTIVAVLIRGNELYWMSVGDSRIYQIRNGEITVLTREHNYRLTLDILLQQGRISKEEYDRSQDKAEALISYLGIGNLRLIDGNKAPILMEKGDKFLLCSDGLYRSMDKEQIMEQLLRAPDEAGRAAQILTTSVMQRCQRKQDNTSVVLVTYL